MLTLRRHLETLALGLVVACLTLCPPAPAASAAALSPPDPAAFYVDLDIRGTVNGLRRRKIGVVTLRFNPSWAPNGVRRIREVSAHTRARTHTHTSSSSTC